MQDEDDVNLSNFNLTNFNKYNIKQILRLKRIILLYLFNISFLEINITDIINQDYIPYMFEIDDEESRCKEISRYKSDIKNLKIDYLYNNFNTITVSLLGTTLTNFLETYYVNNEIKEKIKDAISDYLAKYNNKRSLNKDWDYNFIASYLVNKQTYYINIPKNNSNISENNSNILELEEAEIQSERSDVINYPNVYVNCYDYDYLKYFTITHELGHKFSAFNGNTSQEIRIKLNGTICLVNNDINFNSIKNSIEETKEYNRNEWINHLDTKLVKTRDFEPGTALKDILADWISSNLLLNKLKNDITYENAYIKDSVILKEYIKVINELHGDRDHFNSDLRLYLNIGINDELFNLFITYYNKYLAPTIKNKYLKYKNKYLKLKKL